MQSLQHSLCCGHSRHCIFTGVPTGSGSCIFTSQLLVLICSRLAISAEVPVETLTSSEHRKDSSFRMLTSVLTSSAQAGERWIGGPRLSNKTQLLGVQ